MKYFTHHNAPWLFEDTLQILLEALCSKGEEARVVGGAVRNTLLGEPVSDIDIATTAYPEIIKQQAQDIGARILLNAVKFGTITIILKKSSYEVTTLRTDVKTDGRYAKVCFRKDWKADARRRDFTINALYVDKFGKIYDEINGLHDIEKRILRFIGNAEERIKEDYLRILRFFRFFAWYGRGCPDKQGLKAVTHLKKGLSILSSERVWHEIKKILCAPDPLRSLLWMRQSGVLACIFSESKKCRIRIDLFASLLAVERRFLLEKDPIIRLASLIPPFPEQIRSLSRRFRLSNIERRRLISFASSSSIKWDISDHEIRKLLYQEGRKAILDKLFYTIARLQKTTYTNQENAIILKNYCRLVNLVGLWTNPVFPIKGKELIKLGFVQGVMLGKILNKLKEAWISSDFQKDKKTLLKLALSYHDLKYSDIK